jgi:NADH-quinone oxidoreductase subunit J
MSTELVFFWIVALISVGAAIFMVQTRNPVRSALFLVVCFLCMAVFYVTLSAQFIAAVQIIVYAGAIMVLFLFVIMLLNLGAPEALRERGRLQTPAAITLAAAFIVALLLSQSLISLQPPKIESPADTAVIAEAARHRKAAADEAEPPAIHREDMGTTQTIGLYLFSPTQPWLFPFEITSILLLVAVIGAIIMAKREV